MNSLSLGVKTNKIGNDMATLIETTLLEHFIYSSFDTMLLLHYVLYIIKTNNSAVRYHRG